MSDTGATQNAPDGDFERLLLRLDTDRDRAGQKYEELRRQLIKFFEWRGSRRAEEMADHTMATLERKLQSVEIENVSAYALGIARNVRLDESKKSWRETSVEDIPGGQDSLVDSRDREREIVEGIDAQIRLACLQECRAKLRLADNTFVIAYYSAEGEKQKVHRQKLAKAAGMTMNALRVRANRLREKLEQCVTSCLEDRKRTFAMACGRHLQP